MKSSFLRLNINDLLGAVVSAVIVGLVGYLSTLTSLSEIDFKQVLDIAFLTGIASLLKALGTDVDGKFLGAVRVK